MYSICFTGHRPQKLGGYDWSSPQNRAIGLKLKRTIIKEIESIQETDFRFYFGGALGADQMAFEIVDFLQPKFPDFKFTKIICVPFKNQPVKWPTESKEKYFEQLEKAERVVYVDREPGYAIQGIKENVYHPLKMSKRNHYMVDNSETVIAVYDGSSTGGTAECIRYAKSKDKNIIIIKP